MKPILAASLLALTLAACGGPSEEDVLTPDKIRASESAPEMPDIELSENPEPPPAPAQPEEPVLNEVDNGMMANEVDPLAPSAEGAIPASFQDRWGQRPADCRAGDTIGGGLVISGDSLMSRESVGRLVEGVSSGSGRFTGVFDYDGQQQQEELVLNAGGDVLVRNGVPYRRCSVASPTG